MKIRDISLCLLVVSTLLAESCGSSPASPTYTHQGWDTLQFFGWSIQAPDGFEVHESGGVDSEPGDIISRKDSILIHFDVWNEPGANYEDCASDELEENHESSLEWCEEFYFASTQHYVWEDTINGRFAVLSRPRNSGRGTTSIHFSECHHSLSITAFDLTKEQEELVLEMFATIDWKKDGTER